MDIQALETRERASRGSWLELLTPEGEKSGIHVKVYGSHAPEYRRAVARQAAVQQNSLAKRARDARDMQAEDIENEWESTTEMLVDITLDWQGAEDSGKALACTRENKRRLYENAPDARAQVLAFVRNPKRFLSESSSAPSS